MWTETCLLLWSCLVASSSGNVVDSCPAGWTALVTGCYQFVQATSFPEASANCNNEGGFLVEIDSQEEQDALAQFHEDSQLRTYVYLGGTDENREGQWIGKHSGKEIMNFDGWYGSNPDNGMYGHCVYTYYYHKFKWNDVSCSLKRSGVALCEYRNETEIIEAPSSLIWEEGKTVIYINYNNDKNYKCDVSFIFNISNIDLNIQFKDIISVCSESDPREGVIQSLGKHSFELTTQSGIWMECSLGAAMVNGNLSQIILEDSLQCITSNSSCSVGWTNLGIGCYRLVKAGSHQEATSNCESEGGYLVEIDSQEEQDALSQFLQDSKLKSSVWLGGTDEEREGRWMGNYSGREIMRFDSWYNGLPSGGLDANCVFTYVGFAFKWEDRLCSYKSNMAALCEYPDPDELPTTTITPPHLDWTIIQRRGEYGNAEDYFYKDFNEYENGFGSVDDELWIGLKHLTALTKDGEWELRVDLTDWDNKTYYAKYGTFSVGPAPTYKLHVEGFDDANSTLGDSMEYHNGQSFSARNNDQDSISGNCAVSWRGGWWYKSCHYSNLNGLNYAKKVDNAKGISWYHGKARGSNYLSWKASVMKIRKVQDSHLDGWTSLATGNYRFVNARTFQEAIINCGNEGGYLVEIESQEEQDELSQFLEESKLRSYIWLGGTDVEREGKWVGNYSGREIMKFNAWYSGYPRGGLDENCVHTSFRHKFKWDDIGCSYTTNGVGLCEYPDQNGTSTTVNPIPRPDPCLNGWTNLSTGCYRFVKAGSYQEATTNCNNEGGYLVEIDTQEEQDDLALFYEDSKLRSYVWLGGTDENREGQWIGNYSGREIIKFNAWYYGSPNGGFGRNCLITYYSWSFKWIDYSCSYTRSGAVALCEYPDKNAPIVNFTSPVIDQCQYGWTNLSTGCYRLIKARSHQEATTNCNNEGGYLVEIDTQEEQDNLSLFYEDSKLRSYVFLGGTDENIEGQWIGNYSGREIMRFNPSGGLDENCLITHYQWKLKLEDTSCAFTHYDSSVAALCEYPDENDPPNNSSTAVIDSCVSRWSSLTTGCYRLVKAGSYQEAITNCQNEGGYLVEIETQEEQDALAPFLQDSKLKQMIFFGGTDEEREGRWVGSYSRKEIMKFNGWRNGNPGKGVYGNCVHTYYYYQFKWYDFDCSWKGNAAALCEYPDQNKTITTPDPGTAFIWEQEITTVFIRHKGKNYKCDLTFEFSVDNVSLIVQFRNTDSNCADYEQEEEYIESLGVHSFVFTSPSGLRMDCSVNVAIANEALSQPVIEDSLHCIATNNCLIGWTSLATGCYQLVKAGSHQEAMTNCENEGGFLVEIDSQQEQDALVQFLEASKLRSYIWLGGSDQEIEGQWIGNYSGQEIMKFNAWRYGYPGGGFDENCVRTYSGIQFKWDDCRCSYIGNNAALCEYPNQNDSFASSSTTTVDISEDCDFGWSSLTTGCYKFVKAGSYQEALTNCSNEGGYLVEIETQEEQDALTQFHQDSQLRSTVWLGGTDEEREGQWVGSHSGEIMSFTSWSSGQPAGGFNENCIATDPHYKFKWNDLSCSWKGSAAALCEMPRKTQYSTTTSGAGKETTMTVSTPTPSKCPVCTTALLTTSECPACPSSTPTSCPTPEICPTSTICPSPTICPICTDSTPSTCSTEVPPMTGSCPVCPDPVIPTLIPDTCFDTGCKNAFNGLGMCVDTSTVDWENISKTIDFSAGTKDGECSKDCNCKCFKHTGCYSQECDENFGICLIPEQEEKRGFFIPAEYKKAFACNKSLDCFCYIKNYEGVTQPSDVVTKPRSNSSCKANKKCAKKKGKCFGKGETVPKDAKRKGWCNKKAGCKCYKV